MSYLINFTKEVSLPHQHKNYEIIVYTKGDGFFCTSEKNIPVSKGSIIIVPPFTTHNSSAEFPPERIYINGEFSQIFNLSSTAVVSDNKKGEGLALAKMIFDNRYENPEYVAALCNAFAHFILQNLKMDSNIGLTVKEIIYEVTQNFYDCNINLAQILQKSGYAEDYIRAQFKVATGKTPTQFLTDIRIKHARYLIDVYKDSLSLSQIAEKCGFTDYIYFSRRFRQLMNISPQKYKEHN